MVMDNPMILHLRQLHWYITHKGSNYLRGHERQSSEAICGPKEFVLRTALSEIHHRIAGLDLGADDYLVKPFAFGELEARRTDTPRL
jgi:response regulator of citrate/malate metabolism